METRDAGRRRGPRRHPALAKSSAPPPPRPPQSPRARTQPPLASERRYTAVSSRPCYTDRRCTSLLFSVIPLLTPSRFFPPRTLPVVLYRVLLSHSLFPRVVRASLHLPPRARASAVDPAKRQRRFLRQRRLGRGFRRTGTYAGTYD